MPLRRSPQTIHPGKVLREEFLEPLGISPEKLAEEISLPPRLIVEIIDENHPITANTVLRLARYFDTTEKYWMNLQNRYDLTREKAIMYDALKKIRPFSSRKNQGPRQAPNKKVADQED